MCAQNVVTFVAGFYLSSLLTSNISVQSPKIMPTYANDAKNDASREAKMAEYEKVKKDLKELISKKRGVDKSLVSIEINKINHAVLTYILPAEHARGATIQA